MTFSDILSSIMGPLAVSLGGLVLLVCGGELLISGAVKLARRLGMSSLLIGLTIVAFGTSLPEMFVSITAAAGGHPDIMIGNVVGSNIANVGLILGFSMLLYPLKVHYQKVSFELYLVIGASLSLVVIAWYGYFNRFFGILFVGAILAYTYGAYRRTRKSAALEAESSMPSGKQHAYAKLILFCAGGLVCLAIGSEFFIDGAVQVARFFSVPELIIGLTLAALGTSLPELATSISAIRRRQSSLLVGNVVGSNFFNLFMVMGATATVNPFSISTKVLVRDLPFMVGLTLILVPMLYNRKRLNRFQGLMLLGIYSVYMYLLIQYP